METTNPVGQRRTNLAVVARAIFQNPGISRRELVDRFDIDESSISRLVNQLIELGLVESLGAAPPAPGSGTPGGGRKRIALQINGNYGQVWGLTLWRDRIRATVVDAQGTLLATNEAAQPPYDGDWAAFLDRAVDQARALAPAAGTRPLLGIGIAVPGWIDSENALFVRSDEFQLVDTPCPRTWPEHLPVLWENDANAGAWSQMGPEPDDELYVLGRFLENGPLGLKSELSVGFGLVMRGQLHRGWRHNAGEFLSAFWHPGNRSAYGVDDPTLSRIQSDPEAFRATVTDLLANLRFAAKLLDPRRIHLGGDLKHRANDVRALCRSLPWSEGGELLRPVDAQVDEVSLGAALLVLDELFQRPGGNLRTLFRGYGTGVNDPLWRGIPVSALG